MMDCQNHPIKTPNISLKTLIESLDLILKFLSIQLLAKKNSALTTKNMFMVFSLHPTFLPDFGRKMFLKD